MFRTLLVTATLAASLLFGAGAAIASDDLPEDPVERRRAIFDRAWGPESPEQLEKYVAVRRALHPKIKQYSSGLTQYALREASTQSMLGPVLMSVTITRKTLEEALAEQGLTFGDYQRMTILVYGRWLRASREEPPPEVRIVRTLQEIQIGLERQLAHRDFVADERKRVEARVASIRHQARFLAPYALMDKASVLEGIDPATRAWLDERRAELEELDFGIFDTMAPQRPREDAQE